MHILIDRVWSQTLYFAKQDKTDWTYDIIFYPNLYLKSKVKVYNNYSVKLVWKPIVKPDIKEKPDIFCGFDWSEIFYIKS